MELERLTSNEQGPTPMEEVAVQADKEECPPVPIISLVDYPDEELSTRPTPKESAIPDH